jgi:hypothetical protein
MSRPVVVFYYMKGCHHCEATWPAWRALKRSTGAVFKEVESKDAKGISAFPTFVVVKSGKERARIMGERTDAKALAKELGLRGKRGGTHRASSRRLRHRTLRNYIALR